MLVSASGQVSLAAAAPAGERASLLGEEPMMGEAAFVISDAGDGLRERLNQEISAFNVAATGLADGALLGIAVREEGGALRAGLSGWTWGGCGYIEFLWVREDQRGRGMAAGCWPRRSGRSRTVAAARWP
jgi:hypothetical protein